MEQSSKSERFNNGQEEEFTPSIESVLSVFKQIIGEQGYEETRREEDERGLYLVEIEVKTNEGVSEYSYRRDGSYDLEHKNRIPVIHVNFYNEEGDIVDGKSVAKYFDGKWKLTP